MLRLGGGFKFVFVFTPRIGEMIQFDKLAYFSNGLETKNHQLEDVKRILGKKGGWGFELMFDLRFLVFLVFCFFLPRNGGGRNATM